MTRPLAWLVLSSIWLGSLTGCGQSQGSPEAFVRAIYERFERPDEAAPEPSQVYSPTLADLIQRDRQNAGGEVGMIDGDPLCACQDSEGFGALRVEIRPRGNQGADAVSSFRISETSQTVLLRLIMTPGGWRVDDVATAGQPSLKAMLSRGEAGNGSEPR